MTPEGRVKKECRAWLRSRGCYVYSPVPAGYGQSTIDDLVCYRGLFVGIEYKAPHKPCEPTERQDIIMKQIEAAGGMTFTINDPSQLIEIFVRVDALVRTRVVVAV